MYTGNYKSTSDLKMSITCKSQCSLPKLLTRMLRNNLNMDQGKFHFCTFSAMDYWEGKKVTLFPPHLPQFRRKNKFGRGVKEGNRFGLVYVSSYPLYLQWWTVFTQQSIHFMRIHILNVYSYKLFRYLK